MPHKESEQPQAEMVDGLSWSEVSNWEEAAAIGRASGLLMAEVVSKSCSSDCGLLLGELCILQAS